MCVLFCVAPLVVIISQSQSICNFTTHYSIHAHRRRAVRRHVGVPVQVGGASALVMLISLRPSAPCARKSHDQSATSHTTPKKKKKNNLTINMQFHTLQ
jgi:hypothetical protein